MTRDERGYARAYFSIGGLLGLAQGSGFILVVVGVTVVGTTLLALGSVLYALFFWGLLDDRGSVGADPKREGDA